MTIQNLHDVALRYRNGLDVSAVTPTNADLTAPNPLLVAFISNVQALGYTPSVELVGFMAGMGEDDFKQWAMQAIASLKAKRGAQYAYNPMYPNFPKQVAEASEVELYVNAMIHYWGNYVLGVELLPHYEKEERFPFHDEAKYEVLTAVGKEEYVKIATNLVNAKISFSEADADALTLIDPAYVAEAVNAVKAADFANKENYATLVNLFRSTPLALSLIGKAQTATDLLRVVAVFSGAHPSLSEHFRVGKITRSERRAIVAGLNSLSSTLNDAFKRDAEQWKRVLERLHLSDYRLTANTVKAVDALRGSVNTPTWGTHVEEAFNNADIKKAVTLLSQRPGEFARRINSLLNWASSDEQEFILDEFSKVAEQASTTVLWQLYAWTQTLKSHREQRYSTIFPKGVTGQGFAILRDATSIPADIVERAASVTYRALNLIYAARPSLGSVYYEVEEGYNPAVPFGLRNTSNESKTLGRASRFAFDNTQTLRFFLHWKGRGIDLDLSAIFLDEKFNQLGSVGYYNLRDQNSVHSGDITTAPNGASEFIDVNVPAIRAERKKRQKIRYVAMTVHSYSRQLFSDIDECFVGFMERKDVDSGEVYEPKSVKSGVTINSSSQVVLPYLFDLETGEAIWMDVALTDPRGGWGGIPLNAAQTSTATSSIVNGLMTRTPVLIKDILELNVQSRYTQMVDTPEEADVIVRLTSGQDNTVHMDEVISEWL